MDPKDRRDLIGSPRHAAASLKVRSEDPQREGKGFIMFGKRSLQDEKPTHSPHLPPGVSADKIQQVPTPTSVQPLKTDQSSPTTVAQPGGSQEGTASRAQSGRRTDEYYTLKAQVFAALIEAIDVAQLGKMDL